MHILVFLPYMQVCQVCGTKQKQKKCACACTTEHPQVDPITAPCLVQPNKHTYIQVALFKYMYEEGKSLNNRNFILKCTEKYAQRKMLFRDTKWLLSNMPYKGHDDRAVWTCAIARTTWPLHCQLAPWKSNEALLVFCGQRVWNLLKSTEEWRISMETVVWVRGECMNGWKDFKTEDKTSVINTGEYVHP